MMKKRLFKLAHPTLKNWILFCLSILIAYYSNGQQEIKVPCESLHLTINEPLLRTGEVLWFKVYVLTPESNSKILHIYLLSASDSMVSYKKLQIINNQSFGQILLNDTLQTGFYQLVAFTNEMQKLSDSYARTNITIINPKQKNIVEVSSSTKEEPLLSFFPEGGNLIADNPTITALKLNNNVDFGANPIDVQIETLEGEAITQCQIDKRQIGFFTIKPLPNVNYQARFKINQKEYKVPLPIAKENGYSLTVLNRPASKIAKIIIAQPNPNTDSAQVVISQAGVVFSKFSLNPKQHIVSVNLPYDSIPHQGIVSVDIFDSQKQHIAYRKILIIRDKPSPIKLKTLPSLAKIGEKIEVQIEFKKEVRDSTIHALSVCVIDSAQSTPLPTISDYWKSEIIYDDSETFSNAEIDIELLTAPSTKWIDLQAIKEDGYALKGVLKEKKKSGSLPIITLLLNINGHPIFEVSQTDSSGYFEFRPLPLMDTTQVFLTIKDKNPSNWQLELIENDTLQRPHYLPFTSLKIPSDYLQTIDKRIKTNQLQEVIVTTKKQDPAKKQLRMNFLADVGVGLDAPELSFDINVSDPKITLFDVLKKKYSGMRQGSTFNINNLSTGALMTVFFYENCLALGQYPCNLILNGRLVRGECAQDMQANKIKNVELYRVSTHPSFPPQPYLSINTKDGSKDYDYKKDKPNTGSWVKRGFGYNVPLSFESLQAIESSDTRSTIYWNPNISISSEGKANVSFYAAKVPTTYFLKIEGITSNGHPISTVQRIVVR